jgi:hypothetical protein
MVEATIEDLGIPTVLRGYLTRSDGGALSSTTLPLDQGCEQALELRMWRGDRCCGAQFTAAERGDKGMALKIFTEAKPFPKAQNSLWESLKLMLAILQFDWR